MNRLKMSFLALSFLAIAALPLSNPWRWARSFLNP